ncbi:MAG: Ig-like domain-containing protein, partial [Bacilli bacterium]
MFYKHLKMGFFTVAMLFAMLVFVGCTKPEEDPDDNPDDDPIVVDPTLSVTVASYELEIDEEATIVPIIGETSEQLTVDYEIADTLVCTINNHTIKAVAAGETTITVKLTNYPTIFTIITVKVFPFALTLTGDEEVFVGETITLIASDRKNTENVVFWESLNPDVATVDQNGVVTGKAGGTAVIKISSFMSLDTLEKAVTVIVPEPASLEVNAKTAGPYKTFSEVTLEHQVLPIGASQEVVWSTSNQELATVDANGKVSLLRIGQVEIIAKSTVKDTVLGVLTMNIEVDPVALIKSLNVTNPIVQYVTTYGNTEMHQWVYGSVSKFYPGELNLKENIIPITPTIDGVPNAYIGLTYTSAIRLATEFKTVRSGVIKPTISDIIYHDTGNNSVGANANMHALYIVGSANFETYKARSW